MAHGFYPQTTGLKQVIRQPRNRCRRQVSAVRPGKLRDGRVKSIVPGSFVVTLADEISMSDENDGILGNLPRSRPGVRSEKRASAGPKAKAATPKAPRKAAAPPPSPTPPPPPSPEPEPHADPVGIALKAGETVARTGLKVAGRVAGEVMRRLPRP
jgi:hypothetical protein